MSFKRCFFSKGTLTTSVLSACQMFAKCVDDPQVLELLQKCFVRIKTAKQIIAISHENGSCVPRNSQWMFDDFGSSVNMRH